MSRGSPPLPGDVILCISTWGEGKQEGGSAGELGKLGSDPAECSLLVSSPPQRPILSPLSSYLTHPESQVNFPSLQTDSLNDLWSK